MPEGENGPRILDVDSKEVVEEQEKSKSPNPGEKASPKVVADEGENGPR